MHKNVVIKKGLSAVGKNRKAALFVASALLFICITLAYYDKKCLEIPADFSSGTHITSAAIKVVDVNEPVEDHETLKKLGPITYKKAVVINGEKNLLSYTFDNPKQALLSAKEKDKEILGKMSEKFGLGELTADNWKDYKETLDAHGGGVLFDNETDENISNQYEQLYAFLGAFDDEEINSRTLKLVSQANDYMKIHGQAAIDEIISGLPYTDPACK